MPENKSSLDIVIVNKNAGKLLRRCLDSLAIAAGEGDIDIARVHVVDNASTDGSTQSLPDSLPVSLELLQENIGYGAACNLGASKGDAPYILFLNPDIVLPPQTLTHTLQTLSQHPTAAMLGVRMKNEDGRPQPSRMVFPQPKHFIARSFGLNRINARRFPTHFGVDQQHNALCDCVLGAFLLVRRPVFEHVGGFDPHFFLYYEEIDLAQRLQQAGYSCLYHSDICALHTGGASARTMHAFALEQSLVSRMRYAKRYFPKRKATMVAVCTFYFEPLTRSLFLLSKRKNPLPIWSVYRKAAKTV